MIIIIPTAETTPAAEMAETNVILIMRGDNTKLITAERASPVVAGAQGVVASAAYLLSTPVADDAAIVGDGSIFRHPSRVTSMDKRYRRINTYLAMGGRTQPRRCRI
jgi:hypothetical protein